MCRFFCFHILEVGLPFEAQLTMVSFTGSSTLSEQGLETSLVREFDSCPALEGQD
jgi:hypothetical protein